jgi:hypothetical protein
MHENVNNAAHPAAVNSCALLTSLRCALMYNIAWLQPKELPPLRLPAAKRLVAIGDLHGDLSKVRGAAAATAATALVSRIASCKGVQEGTATAKAGAATLLLVAVFAGGAAAGAQQLLL